MDLCRLGMRLAKVKLLPAPLSLDLVLGVFTWWRRLWDGCCIEEGLSWEARLVEFE